VAQAMLHIGIPVTRNKFRVTPIEWRV